MTKTFVLVSDDQLPLDPGEVALVVEDRGWKLATSHLGFSEQTLRRFLQKNGYTIRRTAGLTITKETPSDDATRPTTDPHQLPSDDGGEGGVASEGPGGAQSDEPVDA